MKKLLLSLASLLFFTHVQAMTLVDGSPATLDNYLNQDKWTLVKIWSHECPACNASMHHVNDFSAISDEYNAQVVGLSIDGPDFLAQDQAFVKKHQLEFPNLVGNVLEVQNFVQKHAPKAPLATPTMMMFAPQGEFTGIVVGSGSITPDQLITYFEENQQVQ